MATSIPVVVEPKICKKGGGGLFLPMFGDAENASSEGLRLIIYGFFLLYLFFGASLVSDYFMTGIETITSKKTLVKHKRTERMVTVLVWNSTVANLTLMALGSSAPEILLSLIESLLLEFYSGELGPSTIVGSAAFNLFTIIAVCIISIPSYEVRRIRELDVYHITAVFSMFAYVWLLMIVVVITPDVIDVAEAVVTVLIFPCLVVICFFADKGYCRRRAKEVIAVKDDSGVRQMKTFIKPTENVHDPKNMPPRFRSILVHHVHIEHAAAIHHEHVEEDAGHMKTAEQRHSQVARASLSLETLLEQTEECSDPDVLMLPDGEPNPAGDDGDVLRDPYGVAIRNDSGVLTFCRDVQEVPGGPEEVTATVYVLRRNGTEGKITCRYHTLHAFNALPGYDYREATGLLKFEHGECMTTIELVILPIRPCENNEKFQVILDDAQGGAEFNPNDSGGTGTCQLTVVIKNAHPDTPSCMDRLIDTDALSFGKECWLREVKESLKVMGDDEETEPKVADYAIHIFAVPWKFFYAVTTPPPLWLGGWLLFFVALAHIGLLTALVCDLASLFGCVLGIQDLVTAIVVVAPGTSLPDLFASKSAALGDDDADASIINVTGSNSVNVFLGIGIPWTVSACYWATKPASQAAKWASKYPEMLKDYPDGAFVVKGGALSFSVLVFCANMVIALSILRIRRTLFDGELGGPPLAKFGSAAVLVFLYVLYSVLSIIKASSDAVDVFQWILIGFAVVAIFITIGVDMGLQSGKITPWKAADTGERDALKENGMTMTSMPSNHDQYEAELPTPTITPIIEEDTNAQEVTAACRSCNNTGTTFDGKPCDCGAKESPSTLGKADVGEEEEDTTQPPDSSSKVGFVSKPKKKKNVSPASPVVGSSTPGRSTVAKAKKVVNKKGKSGAIVPAGDNDKEGKTVPPDGDGS